MCFIHGRREFIKREVASLTKMMTTFTVLRLAKQWDIDISEMFVQVTPEVPKIIGTTANLNDGDALTV